MFPAANRYEVSMPRQSKHWVPPMPGTVDAMLDGQRLDYESKVRQYGALKKTLPFGAVIGRWYEVNSEVQIIALVAEWIAEHPDNGALLRTLNAARAAVKSAVGAKIVARRAESTHNWLVLAHAGAVHAGEEDDFKQRYPQFNAKTSVAETTRLVAAVKKAVEDLAAAESALTEAQGAYTRAYPKYSSAAEYERRLRLEATRAATKNKLIKLEEEIRSHPWAMTYAPYHPDQAAIFLERQKEQSLARFDSNLITSTELEHALPSDVQEGHLFVIPAVKHPRYMEISRGEYGGKRVKN